MKKIMFNDKYGLTDAVLGGRKTMTRRFIPQSMLDKANEFQQVYYDATFDSLIGVELLNQFFFIEKIGKLPYKIGEVVAIAQSYRSLFPNGSIAIPADMGWFNKMFVRADLMPHQIRITNVRVERLNDISESDCRAEGIISNIDPMTNLTHYMFPNWEGDYISNRAAYAALIDRISGKGTWHSSPYVFVYEFELVK